RKRRAGNNRPAEHQFHHRRTQNWNVAGDRRSDPKSPISVLIEAKHLSAERHPERHQKKKYTHDPGELAWKLVGSEKKDLNHVNEDDGYHEIRAPSVQSPDEPSERHIVIQRLQTAPGLRTRRNVN